ncbi:hypothetical protein [Polymorphospora lycopeni]|uniref:Uncharacterized protein n=1 Tax=Polymorphospora lycopeni TaxID=3140240 RepID=A0ABV5CL21_9ACTN
MATADVLRDLLDAAADWRLQIDDGDGTVIRTGWGADMRIDPVDPTAFVAAVARNLIHQTVDSNERPHWYPTDIGFGWLDDLHRWADINLHGILAHADDARIRWDGHRSWLATPYGEMDVTRQISEVPAGLIVVPDGLPGWELTYAGELEVDRLDSAEAALAGYDVNYRQLAEPGDGWTEEPPLRSRLWVRIAAGVGAAAITVCFAVGVGFATGVLPVG